MEMDPSCVSGATACQQDYIFRCNYCIKLIDNDMPVFMQHDLGYCSATCRRRGRSVLYSRLRSLQTDRLSSVSGASGVSTVRSDSSLCSSVSTHCDRAARGPVGWIGAVLSAISSRLPAAKLVQSASSSVIGRLPPGSSFHRLLSYLQEVPSLGALTDVSSHPTPPGSNSEMVKPMACPG